MATCFQWELYYAIFCLMINIINLFFKLIVETVSCQSEIVIVGLKEFVRNHLINTDYNFTIVFDYSTGMSTYVENTRKQQKMVNKRR